MENKKIMVAKLIRFNRKIVLLLSVLIIAGSCEDFLEVNPKDQVTNSTLLSSTGTADLFLNDIYASLPNPYNNQESEDTWTDNAMAGLVQYYSRSIYNKSVYTANNATNYWSQYTNIRKCNVFIKEVTASNLDPAWKTTRLAEARFLRAFFYQLLWTHYGGVPIITTVLNAAQQGDEIFQARNSDLETFEFITSECAAIANDLPLSAGSSRATRGAALTLKGWCELFNASPLKNPDNDLTRWATAAATNKQVMDLGVYELFPDLETMFFEVNNDNEEVIFDRSYLGGTSLGSSKEGLWGIRFAGGAQVAFGGVNPSQELVDEYAMANGLPISDPASGYDPQNPYANREKRFYQSILYDGSTWLGFEMVMKQGVGSKNATDLSNGSGAGPNTGYGLRKGLDPQYAINGSNRLNSGSYIIFRYAEVLLSYAEAQNEAAGPDQSVYDAVNEVRDRSDLAPLALGMSQDQMRVAIQRERRVELSFEEKRWYDLIRLKTAEVALNSTIHCMVIEKVNNVWVYNVKPAADGNRIFYPEKNYLLPIPQAALDTNPELVQNPNYY
jgi:starch-binding outer membrane protein, SusD/RagB family